MNDQLILFEAAQERRDDGSFVVTPKRVSVVKDVGAERARNIIGVKSVKTIYRLCELGEEFGGLKAWKTPSVRGNAKWRIDWESVMGYKDRRRKQEREKY